MFELHLIGNSFKFSEEFDVIADKKVSGFGIEN
jgi:hypothetical protein